MANLLKKPPTVVLPLKIKAQILPRPTRLCLICSTPFLLHLPESMFRILCFTRSGHTELLFKCHLISTSLTNVYKQPSPLLLSFPMTLLYFTLLDSAQHDFTCYLLLVSVPLHNSNKCSSMRMGTISVRHSSSSR